VPLRESIFNLRNAIPEVQWQQIESPGQFSVRMPGMPTKKALKGFSAVLTLAERIHNPQRH
jgi:hypothetical protein